MVNIHALEERALSNEIDATDSTCNCIQTLYILTTKQLSSFLTRLMDDM